MSKLSIELAKLYRNLSRVIEKQAEEIEHSPKLSEEEAGILISLLNYAIENLIPSIKPTIKEDIPTAVPTKKILGGQSLDVFGVFTKEGKKGLTKRLNGFDIPKLKSIIAEHRFDPAGLARKWKDKSRLIKVILDRVEARSKKGDVFRKY